LAQANKITGLTLQLPFLTLLKLALNVLMCRVRLKEWGAPKVSAHPRPS